LRDIREQTREEAGEIEKTKTTKNIKKKKTKFKKPRL
jgi:hypothetical protein